jgi:AmmeMemoRadiSam system protein B/AmmeMemoRadiSam system protein A
MSKELPVLAPYVAGSFYPANPERLTNDIARYLESADVPAIDGEIPAIIVPHAGYVYSAPVAAHAYKAVAQQFDRQQRAARDALDAVIILAFDHRGRHPGVSVYYGGAMRTPLGQVKVHEKIAHELLNSDPRITYSEAVFVGEHSAEVEVPFIQTVLPGVPVVPVLFGRQTKENVDAVLNALEKIARTHRILLVASTDLSHYQPYERANTWDDETVEAILTCDPAKMNRYIATHNNRMCGPGPVLTAVSFGKSQGANPVLLKYANSGDTAGDKIAVVGYAAVAFVKKANSQPPGNEAASQKVSADAPAAEDSYVLSDDDKQVLLQLARRSIESYVRDKKVLKVDPPASPVLTQDGAAFVTLNRNGQLRGCIGSMQAVEPLYKTVIDMAVAAASQDPRFKPVRPEELKDIHIEISVNTPLRQVADPDEIELGKHGVVVAKGMSRGVYLPQVATETGWTKEQFLRSLCAHKAGLAPDAYKNGATLYVFTSIVFEEGE